MERVKGKYLVEIPRSADDVVDLAPGDEILIGSSDVKTLVSVIKFQFYDKMLFILVKDNKTGDTMSIRSSRILGKVIREIDWRIDCEKYLKQIPFDLSTLDTEQLNNVLEFNMGGVKLTIYPKGDIDEIGVFSNELHRGGYIPKGQDNVIDYVIRQR